MIPQIALFVFASFIAFAIVSFARRSLRTEETSIPLAGIIAGAIGSVLLVATFTLAILDAPGIRCDYGIPRLIKYSRHMDCETFFRLDKVRNCEPQFLRWDTAKRGTVCEDERTAR